MQVSMHVYCFNGEMFFVTVHECSCEDLNGHPASLIELNPYIFNKFEASMGFSQNNPKVRATRALREIEGVVSATLDNGNLVVVTHDSWATLESKVTRALQEAAESNYVDRIVMEALRRTKRTIDTSRQNLRNEFIND
jgi:hypothetical protein